MEFLISARVEIFLFSILVFNCSCNLKKFQPGMKFKPGLNFNSSTCNGHLRNVKASGYTCCYQTHNMFVFTPQRFYIKNRILEYFNQTLYLIERITRVLGPHKTLGLPRVLGPLKVLSPPRVMSPPRVLGPPRALGPRSSQGMGSAFTVCQR